jgi:hypothetical protein
MATGPLGLTGAVSNVTLHPGAFCGTNVPVGGV